MYKEVCRKSDLIENEVKSFKIEEREVMLLKSKGKIFCLDARCTHAGAPLAEGELIGEILTCPWHYSRFDIISGKVISGPATKPLKTYQVEEKDDLVLINI